MSESLSHVNASGEANMVDISDKTVTKRTASAESFVEMLPETLALIVSGGHHKGDVFGVARIAGIQAAKKCSDLIPLCHPLMLTGVDVELEPQAELSRVRIVSTCKLSGKTGVEMEALVAASVAALTLFDMCKAVDKTMVISATRVLSKSGGRSGDWSAN